MADFVTQSYGPNSVGIPVYGCVPVTPAAQTFAGGTNTLYVNGDANFQQFCLNLVSQGFTISSILPED